MAWPLTPPSALALSDLQAAARRDDICLSIADSSAFAEVEALARAADPSELFEPLDAGRLAWFTGANPSGPGFLVTARDNATSQLVGHFLFYANMLERMGPDGWTAVPAYLYVHLYVAPSHRRRGVFAAMFAFGLDVLSRMGVEFAYTVPNPRSSPGFVKFGVPLLGQLPVRMAPASRAWFGAARLTSGRADLDIERVDRFDQSMLDGDSLASLEPSDTSQAEARGQRSVAQLEWRYVKRPGTDYAIWRLVTGGTARGYLVTRVLSIRKYRVLAVCDWRMTRPDAAVLRAAFAAVLARAASDRADLVMVQGGPPDRASRAALARSGLIRVPDRFLPQPVAVFGGPPPRVGNPHLPAQLGRWHLTPCDWDVF